MPDNEQHEFETPRVMHDAPLRDSDTAYFHFDEFAATLARLIASKETRTPLTIGVSGPWGSGKTTLLRRTRKMLDATSDLADASKAVHLPFVNSNETPEQQFRVCRTVWFDAWKYADEDELLVALIRVILNTMAEQDLSGKFWSKVLDPQHPRYDVVATFLNMFKLKFGGVEVGVDLDKYKTETPFASHTAFFDFFDQALETLLARWVHGQSDYDKIDETRGVMAVFIDDLDRCLPKKTVQVLEAIKLFLDKPGCVFVLGADDGVIEQAVASHYKDVGITGESARDYLEKIIQLRFELPPILTGDMGRYVEAAKDIVDAEVRRNWQTIVTGAEINPRKVKTFVNDLNLQWAMLRNSGQAQGVNRDDFTRWQVLMRAAPENFYKRVCDLDDIELRRKFVEDALKWAQGDQDVAASFKEYESSLRLRRVLREIKSFSPQFTDQALDAFVHLTAPPQPPPPPTPAPEPAKEAAIEKEVMRAAVPKGIRELAREGEAVAPGAPGQQVWGGLPFVRVPAGKFVMGSKDDNQLAFDQEKPQHTVEIPYDYWIARFPVTNEQVAEFVEIAKYKYNMASDWKDRANHPVVNVSWYDAMEYCKWLNEKLKAEIGDLEIRLPTEAEWEKAARGEFGNEWPWGNEFDAARCNSSEGGKRGTTPVGAYSPQGDSPCGAADMVGNVWEWCHSIFKPYPYKAGDGREQEPGTDVRVLRGGAFLNLWNFARAACRLRHGPGYRDDYLGFRVVVAPRLS